MAESVLAYFIVLCAMTYGLWRFILAIVEAEEEKKRAGELAWQERSL